MAYRYTNPDGLSSIDGNYPATSKWDWDFTNWFSKDKPGFLLGMTTNTSFTNTTFFVALNGSNGSNTTLGYNTQYGWGGGSAPQNMYFPDESTAVSEATAVSNISSTLSNYNQISAIASNYMDRLSAKVISGYSGVNLPGIEVVWNGKYGSGRIVRNMPGGYYKTSKDISSNNNLLTDFWNSPNVRIRTGDALFINTTFSLVFLGGGSNSTGFVIPVRGPDAFKLHFINTASLRAGAQGGWDICAGKMWFNGPIESAYMREAGGYGASLDANLGIAIGWGPGVNAFKSHNDMGKTTWFGGGFSFGYGVGASLGFDYTYITPVFGE